MLACFLTTQCTVYYGGIFLILLLFNSLIWAQKFWFIELNLTRSLSMVLMSREITCDVYVQIIKDPNANLKQKVKKLTNVAM